MLRATAVGGRGPAGLRDIAPGLPENPYQMAAGFTRRSALQRRIGAAILALVLFVAMAWPSVQFSAYPSYLAHRAAEKLGLLTMGPVRASQVLGRYFHGAPPGVQFAMDACTGAATFAAPLIIALLAAGRVSREHDTRCGRCGGVLRGLQEPRCPHCGEAL